MKYEFFVAGKTRNIDKLQEVLRMICANKKTAWCFIEKAYFHGADAKLDFDAGQQKDLLGYLLPAQYGKVMTGEEFSRR